MILNDIVSILQYQVTKKQSSTQICQWKDKANNIFEQYKHVYEKK